jgi:hypothetical protein
VPCMISIPALRRTECRRTDLHRTGQDPFSFRRQLRDSRFARPGRSSGASLRRYTAIFLTFAQR